MYNVFDCETTIKKYMKRTASPFHPDNFVVASGWKRQGDVQVSGLYFGRGPRAFGWFTRLLVGTTILVGANIKFDILHALKEPQNLEAWFEFVARGGNVWDVQLAEYLLRGMEPSAQMMSMDEMVPSYGGNTKIDEVKALWAAGVDTPDIDQQLLMDYLMGTMHREDIPKKDRAHGDIGNTELIFKGQLEKARKSGQVKSILMNCGALLFCTEAERNGMFANKELGLKIAAVMKARLEESTTQLNEYLPKQLPFEFKWSNRYHASPLIFGGKVKYSARTAILDDNGKQTYTQKSETHVVLKEVAQMDEGKPIYKTMEKSLYDTLDRQPEAHRFTTGKNAGEYKTKLVKGDDLTKPKSAMRDFYYDFDGYTLPEKQWASSTEGLYSVASDVIEQLGCRNIPFLKTLSAVATLNKDLTTYYITTDEETGESKGMLTLIGSDSIIHHKLNMTSTVTGRLSASDPNLTNVPKGEYDKETGELTSGSQVKTVFESRFGKDGQIVQSDFTALEIYVQAILTMCRQLIDDLRNGLSMHSVRVAQKEGIPYEEALLLCEGDESKGIKADPVWKKKRQGAKEFSFQRAYGAGVKKIAMTTGMSEEDVEALIKAEMIRYPEIDTYNKAKTERIKKSRRPTSAIHPHPEIPGLMCQLGKGYSVTPDNKVYSYRESPAPTWLIKQGGHSSSFSPTEILNYEVQGTGGEWAKAAMWLAVRAFAVRKNFDGRALLVNMVHDALYMDCHVDVLVEASALLHACMLAASDWMEYYFGWKIPVPVPSVTVHGDNMSQEKPFEAGFKERADELRIEIRKQYMGGYVPSFLSH
jgi:DNA polymerase-1